MDALTKTAAQATLHCLIGCAIGEILGLVIGTALGWSASATTLLAIGLAFLFGYSFTFWPVLASGVGAKNAARITLVADTISIATMELVMNSVIWIIPGAIHAHLTDWLFWVSLLIAIIIAFFITLPVNRWMIGRGLGHAAVHGHHSHEGSNEHNSHNQHYH